jgi:GR25 family glycosyltransferase involved in LPS biosynthesis
MFSKKNYVLLLLLFILFLNFRKVEHFNQYTPSNHFMIFYINLKKRPDRKSKLELELKKLSEIKKYKIQNIRINAIESKHGAIGCAKSHVKALQKAKNENLDHIIVMEDDMKLKNVNLRKYFDLINSIKNWDVIILSGHGSKKYINDDISKAQGILTTGMYIIKNHYYDILIDNFNESITNMEKLEKNTENREKWAIDTNWQKLQKKDNWLIFNEIMAFQRPDYSDIVNNKVDYTKKLN